MLTTSSKPENMAYTSKKTGAYLCFRNSAKLLIYKLKSVGKSVPPLTNFSESFEWPRCRTPCLAMMPTDKVISDVLIKNSLKGLGKIT